MNCITKVPNRRNIVHNYEVRKNIMLLLKCNYYMFIEILQQYVVKTESVYYSQFY